MATRECGDSPKGKPTGQPHRANHQGKPTGQTHRANPQAKPTGQTHRPNPQGKPPAARVETQPQPYTQPTLQLQPYPHPRVPSGAADGHEPLLGRVRDNTATERRRGRMVHGTPESDHNGSQVRHGGSQILQILLAVNFILSQIKPRLLSISI